MKCILVTINSRAKHLTKEVFISLNKGLFIFYEVGGLVGFEGGPCQKNMASKGGSLKNGV